VKAFSIAKITVTASDFAPHENFAHLFARSLAFSG
jgi:hypothetical protein